MPRRFAKIENGLVTQVVVCESAEWLEVRLGGTWVETTKGDAVETYAGKGVYYYQDSQVKFAPAWRQPLEATESYPVGTHVWHNNMIWQSKVANNVWEPGVFGWFDALSEVPKWVQPIGAGSEYDDQVEVMHANRHWRSNTPNNVWEPGVFGWDDITDESTPGPAAWLQPTGAHDAYSLGAIVSHNGQVWVSLYDANVWEPGVFGWEVQA